MEEADSILIINLRDLGCPIDEEVNSIKQMLETDSSLVYKACVTYLKLIGTHRTHTHNTTNQFCVFFISPLFFFFPQQTPRRSFPRRFPGVCPRGLLRAQRWPRRSRG